MKFIVHGQPIDVYTNDQDTLQQAVVSAQVLTHSQIDFFNTEVRDEKGRLLDPAFPIRAYRFEDDEKVFVNWRPGTGG